MLLETDVIYPASELQSRYRGILDEAKSHGAARIRDSDGTSITIIPERRLRELSAAMDRNAFLVSAATSFIPLEEVVARSQRPTGLEWGRWTWLDVFDPEDLTEFVADVRRALMVGLQSGDADNLRQTLHDWRETSLVLSDALSRQTLLGAPTSDAFTELTRPES